MKKGCSSPRKRLRLTRSFHSILTQFSTYVLRSESGSGFYIGFSANLRIRLRQHQNGESFPTSHRGSVEVIYYEAYLNQEDTCDGKDILRVDQAGDFSEQNSDIICCKSRSLDRVAERRRTPRAFTQKSGVGRRFLRAQLRHYLQRFPNPNRVNGFASRGFDHDMPRPGWFPWSVRRSGSVHHEIARCCATQASAFQRRFRR